MITPQHYLLLSSFLFVTGTAILITRKQHTIVLMGLGLMLNAVSLAFMSLTSWFQDWSGQIATLVVMTVATAQLAVGVSFARAYTKATYPRAKERENDKNR